MNKLFTLSMILGCITMSSFGQESKEKLEQKANPAKKEMAAKADVMVQSTSILPQDDGNRLSHQNKLQKREQRVMRRQQRIVRHKRLRHNFHHQHSLIKRR